MTSHSSLSWWQQKRALIHLNNKLERFQNNYWVLKYFDCSFSAHFSSTEFLDDMSLIHLMIKEEWRAYFEKSEKKYCESMSQKWKSWTSFLFLSSSFFKEEELLRLRYRNNVKKADLILNDLLWNYQRDLFDVNLNTLAADEKKIRQILSHFWKKNKWSMRLNEKDSFKHV